MSRKTVRVNVSKRDIDRGEPRSLTACPVALALHRHKGLGEAEVGGKWIGTWSWWTDAPAAVEDFTERFDNGGPEAVSPFSFELELPE